MKVCLPQRSLPSCKATPAALLLTLGLLAACSSAGVAPSPSSAAPLTPARIAEIVASPDRSEADRMNDLRRKPEAMLAFIGIRPGMIALDLSAGGGYTTELLARATGPSGRVYGQSAPRTVRPAPAQPEGAAAPSIPASAHVSFLMRWRWRVVSGRVSVLGRSERRDIAWCECAQPLIDSGNGKR